jgi:hypothetical protein
LVLPRGFCFTTTGLKSRRLPADITCGVNALPQAGAVLDVFSSRLRGHTGWGYSLLGRQLPYERRCPLNSASQLLVVDAFPFEAVQREMAIVVEWYN